MYKKECSSSLRHTLFLPTLVLMPLLLLQGCSAQTVWNIDSDLFMDRLYFGNREFLYHIDYEKENISEIKRLGPGSGYYLSLIMERIEKQEMSDALLEYEIRKGSGEMRRLAWERYINRLMDRGEYDSAVRECELYIRDYPDNYFGHRQLLEAVYWELEPARTLELIANTEEEFRETGSGDHDLVLFRAVSLHRMGLDGWEDAFLELFSQVPASGLHIRAYRYLDDDQDLMSMFTADERLLFSAKMWYSTHNWEESADAYSRLLQEENSFTGSALLLEEAGNSFIYSGKFSLGIAAFDTWLGREGAESGDSPSGLRFASRFSMGKILRARGDYSEAFDSFLEARRYSAPGSHAGNRADWYALSSLLKESPDRFARQIIDGGYSWKDPAFFSDLFEEAADSFVSRGMWETVWKLYRFLSEKGSGDVAARYGYISLRAMEAGLFVPPEEDAAAVQTSVAEDIPKLQSGGYYQLLVELRGGGTPVLLSSSLEPGPSPDRDGKGIAEEDSVAIGYLRFGLPDDGMIYIRENRERLSTAGLYALADEYRTLQDFRSSIVIANMILRRNNGSWNARLRDFCYPRVYTGELKQESEKQNVPWYVMAGLIREESYFDTRARSHAGAVGLAQLMPVTARETADKMGMDEIDLNDPVVNITLGTRYFGDMLKRFESQPALAVCAYNAGPGRVRRWVRGSAVLPEDLFIESVPIEETRNHAKKVLVSSLVYGSLYEKKMPDDIVREYFSGYVHLSSTPEE